MNGENKKKISCSVGILTFNSADTLPRCLKSVADFDEVIIADGGSTDNTLAIARKYGCKIIFQSDQGKLIADFAKERNRMLDAVAHDWFFWLDSDEYMTKELCDEIGSVAAQEQPEHLFYNIRIQRVSPDLSVWYKDLRPNFQVRFFNTKTGARFFKKIHEKINFDRKKYSVGTINSPWCVPLNKLSFDAYKRAVDYRIPIMISEWKPSGILNYIKRGIWRPIKSALKQVIKIILLRIKYKRSEIAPFCYDLYQFYFKWVTMKETYKRYISVKRKKQ